MSGRDAGTRSPTRAGRIDEACDRFEAAWKAEERPRIEGYLDAEGDDERRVLIVAPRAPDARRPRQLSRSSREAARRDVSARTTSAARS
jgi:hypothetical protein